MLCAELKELLMQVALDEASAEERARVEEHMTGCQACRHAFAEWKLTRKLVAQGLPQEEPPQRIRFVPSRQPATGFGGWMWQRAFRIPVGIAAGIALVAFALTLAGARVSIGPGGWEVALGRPGSAAGQAVSVSQTFTPDQVKALVSAAVHESEQRQRAETVQFIEKAVGRLDQRQQTTLHDVSMQMALFDRYQNDFYKNNESTMYHLSEIEKRLPKEREGLQ